jgi:mono/diheme cytochrome c family protein
VRAAPITALLVAALAVTACGTTAKHEPQALFQQNCGSCHAIAKGALSPVVAAPNLYDLHPTRAQITDAVAHGRPGMPRRLLAGDDLEHVIDYILQETAR